MSAELIGSATSEVIELESHPGVLDEILQRETTLSTSRHAEIPAPDCEGLGREGIWLCRVMSLEGGSPVLAIPGAAAPMPAWATACALTSADIGSIVAVAFEQGRVNRPVVVGLVRGGLENALPGGAVALTSDTEISLKCGKASITMKSDGTVAIRGSNVVTRASHTNRIRGGNVQIN